MLRPYNPLLPPLLTGNPTCKDCKSSAGQEGLPAANGFFL
jgi:hypothetical protein